MPPTFYRAPVHWGLGEINGLLVPPGKASETTDRTRLITGKMLKSEPAQEKWFSQNIHTYINRIGKIMKHILSVMIS